MQGLLYLGKIDDHSKGSADDSNDSQKHQRVGKADTGKVK